MPEPILSPDYWSSRLEQAKEKHHAIFKCGIEKWLRIEDAHRQILRKVIGPQASILDAGCGWGRLLELLSPQWSGKYLGIDLSPDFIELARRHHPSRMFWQGELVSVLSTIHDRCYDWGVLISIRPMILRNLGEAHWALIEKELKRVCCRLLYLEYDEHDKGAIE